MTYLLQICSGSVMIATLFLGYQASLHGQTFYVVLNCTVFFINLALIYWQYRIRQLQKQIARSQIARRGE